MQLAECSVPKMRPEEGEIYGREDGLLFYSAEEGVKNALGRFGGKLLLVADEGEISVLGCSSPRTVTLVFDGDALPLFSMPDAVSCVLAAGRAPLLRAARYFAEVRGISCVLFPADVSLDGAYETHGEISLGGERVRVPLKDGEVVCDEARMKNLGRGYARLLLSALAGIERDALRAFGMQVMGAPAPDLGAENGRAVIEENARQRIAERAGAPCGEGVVLARLLAAAGEPVPEWRAFTQLSALYAAFFERGKPRRYFTPDYRLRAERAGTEYTLSGVPSAEEYALRAVTLERVRGGFAREALALLERKAEFFVRLSAWERSVPLRGDTALLKQLPEHAPGGLSSIIRDFGLMEWEIAPKLFDNTRSQGI